MKTLAQEMLKRKYFYLLSEKNMHELILGGINPGVFPAHDYVTDEEQQTIPLTSRGNLAFLSKWGRGLGVEGVRSRWLSLHIKHTLSL